MNDFAVPASGKIVGTFGETIISTVLKQDLQGIVADANIPWRELQSSTVLVTGATGLVGGAIVRALSAADREYGLNLNLIANGRNVEKGAALVKKNDATYIVCDISDCDAVNNAFAGFEKIDYIFHCAAITKSAYMVSNPVDVMTTAIDGSRNLLELARIKGCQSCIYLSSMEVYGQNMNGEVTENDLGYLDLSNPRSSYPESKRSCEMLCKSYATQYNVPVMIARLAQTFGAGTPKDETRVFAQFSRSVMNGEDIVLHTDGTSRGNYCYTADAVRGLLIVLLSGQRGDVYNIANPDASMTIREMAELVVREIGDGKSKVSIEIPPDTARLGYAPTMGYRLNANKLMRLGWKPKYGLAEMYRRLTEDWATQ